MNLKTGDMGLNWVAAGSGSQRDHYRFGEDSRPGDGTREAGRPFLPRKATFCPWAPAPGFRAARPWASGRIPSTRASLDGCVYQLKEGDHVDLMVSIPVDMPGAGHSGPSGASVIATPDTLLRPKRTLEIPLVQDGVVVSPVTARNVPITNSSLMNGTTTRNVRVEEIVIAVAPGEVAPLDEAKALKHKLTCVARSGRPASAPAPAAQPAGRRNRAGWNVSGPFRAGQGVLGKTARPRRTRLRRRRRAKTVNPRRAKRLPRIGWQWTSRPA